MKIMIDTDRGEMVSQGEPVLTVREALAQAEAEIRDIQKSRGSGLGNDIEEDEEKPVEFPDRIDNPDDMEYQTIPEYIGQIVGMAVGAGSSCWENMEGTGVFDDVHAVKVSVAATEKIMEKIDPGDAPMPDQDGCDEEGEGPQEGLSLVERKAGYKFSDRNWQHTAEVQHEEITALRTIVDAQNALLRIRGGMDS